MSVYVYGIARDDHPALPERMEGVGDPPRAVRTVREGGLAAVVSDCPEDLRPRRRDLLAHQQVLTETAAADVVLPLRFGSVSADEDTVRSVLSEHSEHYRGQLAELEGCVEYNVKAAHHEEAVLHQVLEEEPGVRRLSAANQAAGGGTYQDRIRLGELVAEAVRQREERDARRVEEALAPHAERHCPGPEGQGWLANLCLLVRQVPRAPGGAQDPQASEASEEEPQPSAQSRQDGAEGLLAAVDRLREANPQLDVRVSGPLPPYSFVIQPVAADAPPPGGPEQPQRPQQYAG
ncbi:GvpL/GvpF family gas vesicle protein [Streptomyces sp. ODS28]|uniref:GvpL/GvpF family gas vesicle protein n=1 Tax=Streptomyces sp. ODS28 TaxID=3136688 RepID=UPI0031F08031